MGGLTSTTSARPTLQKEADMAEDNPTNVKTEVVQDKKSGHDSRELDPSDTDHPTGAGQAAENDATESPS